MRRSEPILARSPQTGAITIMVALLLLVLLTISAVGMSRNSFREVVASGFSRQGAMAEDVANSGLEWSMYWMDLGNSQGASGTALSMVNEKATLLANDSMSGVAYDITTGNLYTPGGSTLQTAMEVPGPSAAVTEGFTIGLTRMGKLPVMGMSQGVGQGAYTPAAGSINLQAPDLWAVRSDAQVVQGGVTFTHASEAWISTPVQ
jgi:hypothetical protein